jgi:hypothetical protein
MGRLRKNELLEIRWGKSKKHYRRHCDRQKSLAVVRKISKSIDALRWVHRFRPVPWDSRGSFGENSGEVSRQDERGVLSWRQKLAHDSVQTLFPCKRPGSSILYRKWFHAQQSIFIYRVARWRHGRILGNLCKKWLSYPRVRVHHRTACFFGMSIDPQYSNILSNLSKKYAQLHI